MGSSRPSALTDLQRDLLDAFFALEQRFFLTGGAALAGFYFGHRRTEDLDLFGTPGLDLGLAVAALEAAAPACGASLTALVTYPDFRRFAATRGPDKCIVDLVIDRAPAIEPDKKVFGAIRVDTLREIASNKLCAILGRSEIKDLVDLETLLGAGCNLEQALRDAERKDGGANPAAIAWVLEQVSIAPRAALPGGADPARLDVFRKDLVVRLRAIAFARARKE